MLRRVLIALAAGPVIAAAAQAFPSLPAAFRPFPGDTEAHVRLGRALDAGYSALRRGQPEAAIAAFEEAEAVGLMEEPNYLPWIGRAEALCRAGRREEGRRWLGEFRCALGLDTRTRRCETLESSPLTARPDAPSACHRELCAAEIVRGQLEAQTTLADRRYGERMNSLAVEVERRCR